MAFQLEDTIAAIASPPGAAQRGIVRISGPATVGVLESLLADPVFQLSVPTRLPTLLTADELGSPLPADILLWPTSRSYTGQPMAEFHVLGAPPILELLMTALHRCGVRAAERGEFTMRAFLNGRIDLVQAEAVLGVIDAADHHELQAALTQLGGGLTVHLQTVRDTIISILGDLEAGLDFVEEDIEFISADEIVRRLREAHATLDQLYSDSLDRLPAGYHPRVVLAGLPNAGKSTLFNCLIEERIAIESDIAGTTRDYLSGVVTLDSLAVELLDTAGREQPRDGIMEAADIQSQQQLRCADLVIWCRAADLPPAEREIDRQLLEDCRRHCPQLLTLTTCADRQTVPNTNSSNLEVSALLDRGLEELRIAIVNALRGTASSRTELLATTSIRCRDSIARTRQAVHAAITTAATDIGDEITAISLREALHELRAMLGETWTDDILDHIFSSFCIGK
jgi:tRNA modification GTPase